MSTGTFLRFPHHRLRLGEPAGGRLYSVHSAALVSKHFKAPRQIAETLLFTHRNQSGGDHHIIPDLPWGSGLIYGGPDRQGRSDVRIYPV